VRERVEQRLVFVLAVQLHEARREVAKRRGGRERAVDERAASALAADLAADDQLARSRLSRASGRHRGRVPRARDASRGVVEDCFDGGLRLARPDQVGRRARAEQEAHGFNEDGLAGAGLPRQHVEAGLELDLDGFDHREVADAEEAQHARGTAIVSYV